jgi:predicted SAM-dependent methyltransferase
MAKKLSKATTISTEPIKVNLGCGDHILPGWNNHDLLIDQVDVSGPLPYSDNTVSFILAEHILEHLDSTRALAMLNSCYRILAPGGVLRISVPALDKIMELDGSYEHYLQLLMSQHNKAPGDRKDSVNLVLTEWEHKTWWTTELLRIVLWARGFEKISEQEYGTSYFHSLASIDGHATNHWINRYYPGVTDITKKEVAIFEAIKPGAPEDE